MMSETVVHTLQLIRMHQTMTCWTIRGLQERNFHLGGDSIAAKDIRTSTNTHTS